MLLLSAVGIAAKRMYSKMTLVRQETFAKLEAQRAKTSVLSEAVARAGSAAGKVEADVQGLEGESKVCIRFCVPFTINVVIITGSVFVTVSNYPVISLLFRILSHDLAS